MNSVLPVSIMNSVLPVSIMNTVFPVSIKNSVFPAAIMNAVSCILHELCIDKYLKIDNIKNTCVK